MREIQSQRKEERKRQRERGEEGRNDGGGGRKREEDLKEVIDGENERKKRRPLGLFYAPHYNGFLSIDVYHLTAVRDAATFIQ